MPSKVYSTVIRAVDKLVPQRFEKLWHHPAGPRTIFFWAPFGKWALVIAGIGDINRPADHLSFNQSLALAATGAIWSKYALDIKPKNFSLCAVNLLVCLTGVFQLVKIGTHRRRQAEVS